MRFLADRRPAPGSPPGPAPFNRQLLHESREELERADRKAQILLASSGVAVSVVMAGVIAGNWTPLQLPTWALTVWSMGACAVLLGIVLLSISIFPRIVHRDPAGKVAYFGHVASYPNVEALRAALATAAADPDDRTTNQLWVISRIVVRKYRLIRWALGLFGAGFTLALAGSLGGYLWP